MKTDTKPLIAALRVLASDIESNDGVSNAAIAEAADRLEEMQSIRELLLSDEFMVAFTKAFMDTPLPIKTDFYPE